MIPDKVLEETLKAGNSESEESESEESESEESGSEESGSEGGQSYTPSGDDETDGEAEDEENNKEEEIGNNADEEQVDDEEDGDNEDGDDEDGDDEENGDDEVDDDEKQIALDDLPTKDINKLSSVTDQQIIDDSDEDFKNPLNNNFSIKNEDTSQPKFLNILMFQIVTMKNSQENNNSNFYKCRFFK